jgi:predicted PurR-regulated permease PerM
MYIVETLKGRDPLSLLFAGGILCAACIIFWPLIDVIILSFSLAVVFIPVQRKVSSWVHEGYSAFIICASIVIALIVLVWFTFNTLFGNLDYIRTLLNQMTAELVTIDILSSLSEKVAEVSGIEPVGNIFTTHFITTLFENLVAGITGWIGDFVAASPILLIKIVIFFLTLYLFLLNGDKIIRDVRSLIPHQTITSLDRLTKTTVDTMYSVYIVNVESAILTFILALPYFMFLGYGHVLFWSTLCGLFQLIPFLGPQILIAFLLIYEFLLGDIRGIILTICVGYPLISGIADFYFRPKRMGTRMAIHPVLMMVGIFGGMLLMGLLGIVLGPLIVALIASAYDIIIGRNY